MADGLTPVRISRRSVIVGGSVAIAAAVGARARATAPLPAPSTSLQGLERSVVVIGDSITEETQDVLYQLLRNDGFSTVTIDAERSRRITVSGSGGVPRAGLLVATDLVEEGVDPTAWIVALGTNDIGSYSSEADFGRLIDAMLYAIPSDSQLVWVNTFLPDRVPTCETFNRALESKLRTRGRAAIASWFDANQVPLEDMLRSDRIHPNDRGAVVFPTLAAKTLRQLMLSR